MRRLFVILVLGSTSLVGAASPATAATSEQAPPVVGQAVLVGTHPLIGGGTSYDYNVGTGAQELHILTVPPGFDAINASADVLSTYGLPPRPDPGIDLEGYAAWAQRYATVNTPVPPQQFDIHAGQHITGQPNSSWAGYTVGHQTSGGQTGYNYFSGVDAKWTEPTLSSGGYGGTKREEYSFWTGLGGVKQNGNIVSLFNQNGTDFWLQNGNRFHYAWVELWGLDGSQLFEWDTIYQQSTFPLAPGDSVESYCDWNSNSHTGTSQWAADGSISTQNWLFAYSYDLTDHQFDYVGDRVDWEGEGFYDNDGYPVVKWNSDGNLDFTDARAWVGNPVGSATVRRIGWSGMTNSGSPDYNNQTRYWYSSDGTSSGDVLAHPSDTFSTDGGVDNAFTFVWVNPT